MPIPTTNRTPSISQQLCAIKDVLQGVTSGTRVAAILDKAEFDVLERDAFEILHLIRSWRNGVAPINKIPPEILTLLPDFWPPHDRDQDVVALTHVCRARRELFTSRSSLWTNFNCLNANKTLVYLERSEPSPIHLWLNRKGDVSPHDPFFQVVLHAIGRLISMTIRATPDCLQDITARLSRPAPLLEELSIGAFSQRPMLTPTLFDGDLSSLRKLRLDSIYTELPWRGLINLTSFTLARVLPVSVWQLLDFFESTPHILQVELHYVTQAPGAQTGRLVSLARLEGMIITGGGPPSVLLNHLLIPVGARLTMCGTSIEDLIPRSLDNLRNLSDFTKIQLEFDELYRRLEFSGPNGKVTMILSTHEVSITLESLAWFDTPNAPLHGRPTHPRTFSMLAPRKS